MRLKAHKPAQPDESFSMALARNQYRGCSGLSGEASPMALSGPVSRHCPTEEDQAERRRDGQREEGGDLTYPFTPDRDREPEQQPVKADRCHDQEYDSAHQVREFRAGHKSVPLVANPSGLRLLGRQHFQLADAADADVCPPFNLVTEVAAVADARPATNGAVSNDFLVDRSPQERSCE